MLHCWSPPAVVVSQRKARKCSHVPAYLLLWFGLVRELFDRNALPVLFHTPKDVPGNNPPIRKTKSPRASAYLRSLTATLAPFSSHPFVRQNASQLSIDTFFSEPRPIAFKKSPGVAILPDHCLVSLAQYGSTMAYLSDPVATEWLAHCAQISCSVARHSQTSVLVKT